MFHFKLSIFDSADSVLSNIHNGLSFSSSSSICKYLIQFNIFYLLLFSILTFLTFSYLYKYFFLDTMFQCKQKWGKLDGNFQHHWIPFCNVFCMLDIFIIFLSSNQRTTTIILIIIKQKWNTFSYLNGARLWKDATHKKGRRRYFFLWCFTEYF